MKIILRSLMWTSLSEQEAAKSNLQQLNVDRFLSLSKSEKEILEECSDFLVTYADAPSFSLVYDNLVKQNKAEAILLMEDFVGLMMETGSALEDRIERIVVERSEENLIGVLRTAGKIVNGGEKIGRVLLKGVEDAISFLQTEAKITPPKETILPNSLKEAEVHVRMIYDQRENNPASVLGVPTGYGFIDGGAGGIHKGNFYIHAGYGGHLKTTFMLNCVVNEAVMGWNSLIFSSEMPRIELVFLLVAIHSGDVKFSQVHQPLDSKRLRAGRLTPEEKVFYLLVYDDLVNNQDHGDIRVIGPEEFTTFGSIRQRTIREHAKKEVDILWMDYLTRLPLDAKYRNHTQTEAMNETIADAKRFAMSANRGQGIAVATPFQVNREGFKRGKANGGRLDKTALGAYNASEKEGDLITYIFYDDDEKMVNEPKVGIIKSRWGEEAKDPVSLYISPHCRRIYDLSSGVVSVRGQDDGGSLDDVEL